VNNGGTTRSGNDATDTYGSQIIANSMMLRVDGIITVSFDRNSRTLPNVRAFGLVE
jgi:hypothetical protein